MGRLIDADKIIFREIDEIGGDYEPYLGCSKSQINNLPTVEAIQKADYETRLKADMVAMLTEIQLEIKELWDNRYDVWLDNQYYIGKSDTLEEVDEVIQQKINALKGENETC